MQQPARYKDECDHRHVLKVDGDLYTCMSCTLQYPQATVGNLVESKLYSTMRHQGSDDWRTVFELFFEELL